MLDKPLIIAENALIVEDEPALLRLFTTVVRFCVPSAAISTANGGEKAIQFLKRESPQLLILDLAMPGVDGNDVLDYILTNPDLAEMVIIVLTAVSSRLRPEHRQRVAALLIKPISPRDLERILAHYFISTAQHLL